MHTPHFRRYWTSYGLIAGASIGVLVSQLTDGSLALLIVVGSAFGLVAASIASLITSRNDELPQTPAEQLIGRQIGPRVSSEETQDG